MDPCVKNITEIVQRLTGAQFYKASFSQFHTFSNILLHQTRTDGEISLRSKKIKLEPADTIDLIFSTLVLNTAKSCNSVCFI